MKLFPKAAELEAKEKRIQELELRCNQLTQVANHVHQAESETATARQELQKIKAQVREQTTADLMLVSARIIAGALKGEKLKEADISLQRTLYSQQQQMANSISGYGLGGAGTSLFGAIFGH